MKIIPSSHDKQESVRQVGEGVREFQTKQRQKGMESYIQLHTTGQVLVGKIMRLEADRGRWGLFISQEEN